MDLRETLADIADTAGVETSELPLAIAFGWFPFRSPIEASLYLQRLLTSSPRNPQDAEELAARKAEQDGYFDSMKPTVFRVFQRCPLNLNMSVLAIFEGATEARVYCLHTVTTNPDGSPQKVLPPTLYRVSKTSPIYSTAAMTMEVFESEVAKELQEAFKAALPFGYDEAYENERFRVIASKVLADPVNAVADGKALLEKIEAELEAELDEDAEEEKTEVAAGVAGVGGVGAAPAAAPPPVG
jgi:hypothetical protein